MRKRSYPVSRAALRLFLFAALLCSALPLWAYASDTPEIIIDSITAAPDYSTYKSPIAQICAQVSPITDSSGSFSAEVFINGAKANRQDCAWSDSLNTYDAESSAATVYLRVPVDQGLHDYLSGAGASLAKDYTFSVRLQYYDAGENGSPVLKECVSFPYTIAKYTAPAAPKPVIKKIAKYSSSSTALAYVYVDNCTAGTVYMDDVKRSTCTYVPSKKAFKVNVPAELGKYLAGKTKVLPNAHVFRVVSSKGVKSANKTVAATVAKPVISKVTKYSSASNTYAYVYCSNCTKEAKVYLNGTKKTAAYEAGKKRFKVAVPAALGQYLNGSSQFLAKSYSFKVINKAGSVSAVKTIAAKPDIPAISNIGKYQNTYAYVYVSNFSKTYGFKCEIDSGSGWKSATSSYVSSKSALKVKVDSALGKYLKGTNKYIDKDYKFRVTCNDKNKKGKVSAVYTIKRNSAPPSITAVRGQVVEEYVTDGDADLGYRIASAAAVTVKSAYTNYTVWLNGVQVSKAASVGSSAYHVPYELARYLEGSSSQLSQEYKFVVKNPDGKSSAAKVIKASYPDEAPQIAQVSTEGECWIKLYVTDCPSGKVLIDGQEAVSFSTPVEGDEVGGYFVYVYDESEIAWVANGWRSQLSKNHTIKLVRGDNQETVLYLNAGMTRDDYIDDTPIVIPTPIPTSTVTPNPTPQPSPPPTTATDVSLNESVLNILGYSLIEENNSKYLYKDGVKTSALNIPEYYACYGIYYRITEIENSTFSSCVNLTSVTIPDSVTAIGDLAFYNCSSLNSLTIPNGVTYIGCQAFCDCSSLTSLTIPNSVTTIREHAFKGCSNLTALTIPDSITTINEDAFYGCSNLKSLTIPNSVTTIQDRAFYGCSNLNSLTISNSATAIGYQAFYNCSSLNSLTIPDSVTTIGGYAFYGCSNLTALTIPDSVTSIQTCTFSGCSNLTSLTLPNNIKYIGSSAFFNCSSLNSLTIPNSATFIGNYAFYGCANLTSLTIPDNVMTIGKSAFYSCSSLTALTIPNRVKSIEEFTFYGCASLTSLTIPNSITNIGEYAFSGCSSLTSLILPDSITTIGAYAFKNCTKLHSITLSNSLTTIGAGAFFWCSSLTSLTIPNSVTALGYSAFENCSSLTSLTISNRVISIENDTFSGCSKLTSLNIPDSVMTIGNYAFHGCSSLNTLTISNSVTSIGDLAFKGCSSLTSLTIPNSVTAIGNGTFSGCSSLTSLTISNNVASIGCQAFNDCSNLSSLTIPNSVKIIGEYAFYGAHHIYYSGTASGSPWGANAIN